MADNLFITPLEAPTLKDTALPSLQKFLRRYDQYVREAGSQAIPHIHGADSSGQTDRKVQHVPIRSLVDCVNPDLLESICEFQINVDIEKVTDATLRKHFNSQLGQTQKYTDLGQLYKGLHLKKVS